MFGAKQPQAGFGFGQQPAQQSVPATPSSTFGQFGNFNSAQPQQPQQPQQSAQSPFGTPSTSTNAQQFSFGSQPTSSMFGQSQQAQPQQNQPQQTQPQAQTQLFGSPATAPTSGGLFGNTAVASSTTPVASTTTTSAPTTTGLFGQASVPSTTNTSATTATPSFSFGAKPATSSTTTTTPSTATTTPATATTTTTTPGLFSFNNNSSTTTASKPVEATSSTTNVSTPASTSTSANIASTTATKSDTSSIQFPSNLKSKTIEEIIVSWNEELENQIQEFQRQAVSLSEWDKKILHNAERVGKLNTRVSEMEQLHRELEQGVTYVTAQQAELESLLDGIDRELPKMVTALGKQPQVGSDADRAKTFHLAESLQVQLNDVSSQLSRLVNQVNTASSPKLSASTSNNPTTDVAQILNNHFETLAWIEEQVSHLQRNALETQKMGERANAEHERLSLSKNY
jgi:nuclear pore complex protein Nup62